MEQSERIRAAVRTFRSAAFYKEGGDILPAHADHAVHAEMARAVATLDSYGSEGVEALNALAHDSSPHVRGWAAAELLSRGSADMVPILEALAGEGGLLGLSAAMVLKEYRAGRLRSPFGEHAP